MSEQEYQIDVLSDGLSIKGPNFKKKNVDQWSAKEMGANRLLLQPAQTQKLMGETKSGNAWCSVDAFADFLFGIHHRRWTGVVAVDTNLGIKKIYFDKGHIVFATTSNIDERLGEIIYRNGMLKLDDLMNCTIQVTKTSKFGQVLLAEGVFTNAQLWEALKSQVLEIVRSVFMVNHVYFELDSAAPPAPTEIVFIEGTEGVIDSCYGYGCMFRDFISRLSLDGEVKILNEDRLKERFKEGTFVSDMIQLLKSELSIEKILKGSKLMQMNTLAALMMFVNLGYCEISNFAKSKSKLENVNVGELKQRIEKYRLTLNEVRSAFLEVNKKFPIEDLRSMAKDLDEDNSSVIFLAENGEITTDSIERILSQCRTAYSRSKYFERRIRQLNIFLLQIAGDNLPFEKAKLIRQLARSTTK